MPMSLSEIQNSIRQETLSATRNQQAQRSLTNSNNTQGRRLWYKPYVYNVTSFEIMHDDINSSVGATENGILRLIGACVNNIIIYRDYDNMLNPVFQITLNLPPLVKKFVIEHKLEVKYHLRIDAAYKNDPSSLNPNGDMKKVYKDFINAVFVTYMEEEDNFDKEEEYEKTNEVLGLSSAASNLANYTENFTLYLWREGHVEGLRKVVNKVYSNVTVKDVIMSAMSEVGIKNVLMSKPENTTSYEQLILPPTRIMNLTNYLDESYGLYYGGTTFFCDFNYLYILNKNSTEQDAFVGNDYRRVMITVSSSDKQNSKRIGVADDTQNREYWIYGSSEDMDIISPAKTSDLIQGGNMYVIDSRNGTTTQIANTNDSNGTYKIMEDRFGNSFNKGQYASDIMETNTKVAITFTEYDIGIFTPNKEYIFNFEETDRKKFNGTYRLLSEKCTIMKKGGELRATGLYTFVWKSSGTGAGNGGTNGSSINLGGAMFAPNIGLGNLSTNIGGLSSLGVSITSGISSAIGGLTSSLGGILGRTRSVIPMAANGSRNLNSGKDLSKACKGPRTITDNIDEVNNNMDVTVPTLPKQEVKVDNTGTAVTNYVKPSSKPNALTDRADKLTVTSPFTPV